MVKAVSPLKIKKSGSEKVLSFTFSKLSHLHSQVINSLSRYLLRFHYEQITIQAPSDAYVIKTWQPKSENLLLKRRENTAFIAFANIHAQS